MELTTILMRPDPRRPGHYNRSALLACGGSPLVCWSLSEAPIDAATAGAPPALFLFAHHDDELFAATAVARERLSGARVTVAYTTHGSRYGTPSPDRVAESLRALADLGVPPGDVLQPGLDTGTFDFSLVQNLALCYGAAREATAGRPFARVYVHAWEGGHPDHDATHLLGVRLARERGATEVLAFPAYRAALGAGPLWRTLCPLPGRPVRDRGLTASEGWRALGLARRFPSQWKSLAGLLPGAAWQLCARRRERLETVGALDYAAPPHPGRLFYERRYGFTFAQFSAAAAPFLREGGLLGVPRPAPGIPPRP